MNKSRADQEAQEGRCKLCNNRLNTMHLMFDCEKYSEMLWNTFESVVNDTLRAMGDERNTATRI